MTRQMTGAKMVVQALKDQGVDTVFGYPGGAVLPIYDEIFQQNDIKHILVRHEQGAVHAAEGYARSTGKVGVALVTSGPGATNAVTGLTDALMDSIPILVLTGQVPTFMIGSDAFQEADTVGITRPCTKHNWLVKETDKLAGTIHEAFHVATSGRPGPVLVDIPKDVQFATGTYTEKDKRKSYYAPQVKGDIDAITALVKLMETAKKPLFYTGGGVINSGPAASKLLRELVAATGFPITSTLMGLGAYPASGEHWLGMLGMHGLYEANLAMHDCDLMINIGARFDDRITGRIDAFSPGSKKAHIDIDASSINKVIRVDIPILGDVGNVLDDLLKVWTSRGRVTDTDGVAGWWKQIREWQAVNYLHRGWPAPDVGGAVSRVRGSEPLDDLGRSGDDGLWVSGLYRGPDGAPRRAGHQRRGRGIVADEHAGNGHRDPVPPAGQTVHPEQRTSGHGAPVAAVAARRAVLAIVVRSPTRFRQTGRGLRGQGHPLFRPRRSGRGDHGNAGP